jgi:arylsulfatase A-like enzyme
MADSQSLTLDVTPRSRPNVVLILADDMGFSDLGCFGSEIQTPNLDRLAQNGARFTQAYNCARCCPSRAALLTGIYPHEAGVGHMVDDLGIASYQGFLNDRCVTLAEALREGGYRTYMSGKWHVGGQYDTEPESWNLGHPRRPRPLDRGFERYFGTLAGAGSYFDPHTLMRDNEPIAIETDDFYYTDVIADEAVQMIRAHQGEARPFFLYTAFTAPHWPLHALPEDIARYVGKYRQGWDAVRTARHESLKGMGIIDTKWEITPRDEQAPPWSDVSLKDWEDLRMAVYAAQIDRLDQGVGRIMAELERQGIADNTLVIFLSDNGGCAEFLAEDGTRRNRSAKRVTRDGRPMKIGNVPGREPGPDDTYMSYDLPWANASNTPFRLYKHWVHEGGIGTPMIVHWPAVIQPGRLVHEPCHFVDIMPTLLDAAGVKYPGTYQGRPIIPLRGESLLPAFRADGWTRQTTIYWEHEGNRAVRQGQWKLVSKHPGPWELYDMTNDRTELNDLSDRYREVAQKLARQHAEWAELSGVVPWEKIQEIRRRRS